LSHESNQWQDAVRTEFKNIVDRNVWKIIDRKDMKKDIRPLGTKWVMKVKNDGRYRARLVVQGFTQIPGIDFKESHAPVANDVTICLLLSLSITNKWAVQQIDVETAFLYGELNETVYLKKPLGFDELSGNKMNDNQVLALDKALYGLVQAARMWLKTLITHLTGKMQFKRSRGDPCFLWKYDDDDFVGVLIYVDLYNFWCERQGGKVSNQTKQTISYQEVGRFKRICWSKI
jgi:Reverse transcriptase (RNA-dependent DNA polymerase)